MKKLFCMLLVLLLLAAAVPMSASADEEATPFTARYIPKLSMSSEEWLSTEEYRCAFAVLILLELTENGLLEASDIDSSRDQYLALASGYLVYACPIKTGNAYVLTVYDNSNGEGLTTTFADCSSSVMKSVLSTYDGIQIYTIDKDTFIDMINKLIDTVGS